MNVLKHKIICEWSKKTSASTHAEQLLRHGGVCLWISYAQKETNGEQRAAGALAHSRIYFICKNEAGIAKGKGKRVWSYKR